MNNQKLSCLVIGESGHGKSEFILSFINIKDRKCIPASGLGQTTRTSIEYHINIEEKELEVVVFIKNKERFIESRLDILNSTIKDKESYNKYARKEIKQKLILDTAFFNIEEWGEEINSKVNYIYDKCFDDEFFNAIIKEESENFNLSDPKMYIKICNILDVNYRSEKDILNIDDCFKVFFSYVYDICKRHLESIGYEKTNFIVENEAEKISPFIKAEQGKRSYSSIVEKIVITTSLVDEYKDMIKNLKINELFFLDTYGLDHAENGKEIVEKRYVKLFNNEYQDLSSVLYLRSIEATESPSDLVQNIPLIYEVKPQVVPYLIFTKADKKSIKFIEKIETKEVSAIIGLEATIGNKLSKAGISETIIDNRFKVLINNLMPYCSSVGVEKNVDEYWEINKKNLSKLFKSIKYKEYLGTSFINIDKMKKKVQDIVVDVDMIMKNASFDFDVNYYPSRTKGALHKNLKSGVLGFDGTTTENVYWNNLFSKSFNKYYGNIMEVYGVSNYLETENESVLTTISELFLVFARKVVACRKNEKRLFYNYICMDDCSECYQNEKCIREIIYYDRKNIINKEYRPIGMWLTDIYNFIGIKSETKEKLKDIIRGLYLTVFIDECRNHNARNIAQQLNTNMSAEEIEYEIEKNLSIYDTQIEENEKDKFKYICLNYII